MSDRARGVKDVCADSAMLESLARAEEVDEVGEAERMVLLPFPSDIIDSPVQNYPWSPDNNKLVQASSRRPELQRSGLTAALKVFQIPVQYSTKSKSNTITTPTTTTTASITARTPAAPATTVTTV